MLHGRLLLLAPTKTNAKLAVRVHAFIALAIHVQYPSSLILHLKKRKIRPISFKTSRSAIRFCRCCASAGDRQIDCGCTMKFNPYRCHDKHLCSLIDESDIVNVVSCDDIFMLSNADSLSPFEISPLIVLNESGFFSVAATEDGKRC